MRGLPGAVVAQVLHYERAGAFEPSLLRIHVSLADGGGFFCQQRASVPPAFCAAELPLLPPAPSARAPSSHSSPGEDPRADGAAAVMTGDSFCTVS